MGLRGIVELAPIPALSAYSDSLSPFRSSTLAPSQRPKRSQATCAVSALCASVSRGSEMPALARRQGRAGGRGRARSASGPARSNALADRGGCDRVELLCGRECPCAGVAAVAAGGEPAMARERAGEGVFGAVADGGRDRSDRVVGVAQPLGGEVHAPAR